MKNNPTDPTNEQPLYTTTPQQLPRPTYFPFFVAMGTAFIFWGLVTSYWISAIGLLVFGIGIRGWIFELLLENKPGDKESTTEKYAEAT